MMSACVGALALALVGCSAHGGGLTGGTPVPDPLVTPTEPLTWPGDGTLHAVTIVGADVADAGTSLPWAFDGFTDDSRRTVRIEYIAGGGCTKPLGVYVGDVDASRPGGDVELAAIGSYTQPNSVCTADLAVGAGTVELPRAITGDVHLVHAGVDPSWAHYADQLVGG